MRLIFDSANRLLLRFADERLVCSSASWKNDSMDLLLL